MADTKKWHIPVLEQSSYEDWFRSYKFELRAKEVYYVVEAEMQKHCAIAKALGFDFSKDIAAQMEELDINDPTKKVILNIEKKKAYLKDEATAISLMFRALSQDDRALVDKHDTAFKFWAYLKVKYSVPDELSANTHMTKIQTFTFDKNDSITTAWDRLQEYNRKLEAADSHPYTDKQLYHILTSPNCGIPKEYSITIEALAYQAGVKIDDKIRALNSKYATIQAGKQSKLEKKAHWTSEKKYVPPHQRKSSGNSDIVMNNAIPASSDIVCYLCEREGHGVASCEFLEMSKAEVKHILRRRGARQDGQFTKPRSRSSKNTSFKKLSQGPAKPRRITHRAHNAEEGSDNLYDSESSDEYIREESARVTQEQIHQ